MAANNIFTLFLLFFFLASARQAVSYFVITSPTAGSEFVNDAANVVRWIKGVLDDIEAVDVKMARRAQDGLIYVARSVPVTPSTPRSFNLYMQDIPAGDDYFILFFNSTHGGMYARSEMFTILPAGQTPTTAGESPDATAPTITISGAPDPLKMFATTMAGSGGVLPILALGVEGRLVLSMTLAGCVLGAFITLW